MNWEDNLKLNLMCDPLRLSYHTKVKKIGEKSEKEKSTDSLKSLYQWQLGWKAPRMQQLGFDAISIGIL